MRRTASEEESNKCPEERNFLGFIMFSQFVPESSGQKLLFSETLHCILWNKTRIRTVSDRFLAEFGKKTSNFGEAWQFPGLCLPMNFIIKRKKFELSIFS